MGRTLVLPQNDVLDFVDSLWGALLFLRGGCGVGEGVGEGVGMGTGFGMKNESVFLINK